ncbi:Isopentenyldiphosphate isomerase [Paenibacillus sp. UNCCL117]|uniref:NUDIX hydrolase n=1 Tax=unclassified Paenibacillus TaxID=185978 RepID=UPI000884646B|nr:MULTISPECIES: NUDIX domain-containing protein [unclassified Paenibacillus]SDC54201.1 Isopentenyldiphosphate isomerase [Paenibacillus sp. cl123]SFW11086.1 Isopentenyldiphosphate isomerase [Paenibacillus sp. UNCCL117]
MEQELFDIFDRQRNRIGTATRAEVHAKGLWHQTFHCWIWTEGNGGPEVLVQLRHPEKDTFPGLLDISCAGHLLAGESAEDGVRELEEELGLQASFSELSPVGIFTEEDIIAADCIDREFCHIYLLRSDWPLHRYSLQPDEVTGLYAFGLGQLRQIAAGTFQAAVIEGVKLGRQGQLEADARTVSAADFVPHPAAYYEMVADAVEAKLAGK